MLRRKQDDAAAKDVGTGDVPVVEREPEPPPPAGVHPDRIWRSKSSRDQAMPSFEIYDKQW